MPEEPKFKGKTIAEIKQWDEKTLFEMLPSRQRRSLKRGLTPAQKVLMIKIKKANEGTYKKKIKTHCRNMIILPQMVGLMIHIHNGKEFVPLQITVEMIGHYLGEFAQSRKRLTHSAPGVGATKSSSALSVK